MTEIISIIGAWLICAIAAERTAEAITTSVFFSPLRQFLARVSLMETYSWTFGLIKTIGRWLSELVSCGWCTSLWTSLFFSFFLPGKYLFYEAGDNLLVKAIALWGFANLYHSIFRLIHNGRVAAVDVNFRLTNPENIDSDGGINGESGQGISQEESSGTEPSAV